MLKDLTYFFTISRPPNILISLVAFGASCYIASSHQFYFLQDPHFWGVSITIILIAATGYWINDVYDFRIDRINKPQRAIVNAKLSVKKVLTAYIIVNFAISFFSLVNFSLLHGLYPISFINITSIVLLFWYASYLKRTGAAGNLLIAFLIALVVLLAGYLYRINMPLIWTLVFAFQITLIREITKDVEDIKGDLAFQLHTLPIQIGIRNTKRVLTILYILFIVSCNLPLAYYYLKEGQFLWEYLGVSLTLVQLPIFYLLYLLTRSAFPSDFSIQSRYLKYIMVSGILSILLLG
ncbi:MAG: geranylgeranylglycerol-phosphate geranylgeranyltransferase [Bacteroidota bacterium]